MRKSGLLGTTITFLSILVTAELSAQTETPVEIKPAHVFQQVELVRAELALIRMEMGKPTVEAPPIRVEKAEPREVFFQAMTLFEKSNRLAYEHTREKVEQPASPEKQILPADVYRVVTAALERVRVVKVALEIEDSAEQTALDPDKEPSDVFNAILAANRELNRLLDRELAPGDVYQQVTLAIAYLSRLLDSADAVSTPPEPPPFERRKRPQDVYGLLVGCFGEIREVGEKSGVTMLNLQVDETQIAGVAPNDVYDIAALLVSELDFLHGQKSGASPPRKVFDPGRKLPSHVYQRVGVLCEQMEQLLGRVKENPDWLKD